MRKRTMYPVVIASALLALNIVAFTDASANGNVSDKVIAKQ